MENCKDCGAYFWRSEEDFPHFSDCHKCGEKIAVIVTPAEPELSEEQKHYMSEIVELVFPLGFSKERNKRIAAIRQYRDELREKSTAEFFKELKGKENYSFGKMPRSEALWHMDIAKDHGLVLVIVEKKQNA